ncbi:MAG: phasin family protein, partial [Burkholderiales bacterium]
MNTPTNQEFAAAGKANVESFEQIAGTALAGVEQLAHLNLAVAKAVFAESFDHVQSLMNVRDPQQFIALQAGMMQPSAEKATSYGRQVYEIVSNTGAEIAKSFEGKMTEAQQAFVAAVDSAAKNAPAGSETAVAL